MIAAELHQRAMELVDRSILARARGEQGHAAELMREAYETERQAALAFIDGEEPSRSVLLRSAASLALEVKELRQAEQLIAAALAGDPPAEIADELRDLLEQAHFERHLDLRGIQLMPGEFQVSLSGNYVGFGIAESDAFVQRVHTLETVLYRTAERKRGREFGERSRRKEIKLFVSSPRAASLAITFRLGGEQLFLPGQDFGQEVVDEVLDCFDLFVKNDTAPLRDHIADEAYFNNFVGLARRVAPDGEEIRSVGLTGLKDGKERRVVLPSPPREATVRIRPRPQRGVIPEPIIVQGTLKASDSRDEARGRIIVVDASGIEHRINVPRGMMRDIVRPMYEDEVRVTGRRWRKVLQLESIDPVT